jgi:hypothetical protein
MLAAKIWQTRSVPVRLVSMMRDQSASGACRRGFARDAGGVHENIDLAEGRQDSIVQGLDRGTIENVAYYAKRATAQRFNLGGGLLHFTQAARTGDNIGTSGGQAQGHREAKARGSASNYGHSARQIE